MLIVAIAVAYLLFILIVAACCGINSTSDKEDPQ